MHRARGGAEAPDNPTALAGDGEERGGDGGDEQRHSREHAQRAPHPGRLDERRQRRAEHQRPDPIPCRPRAQASAPGPPGASGSRAAGGGSRAGQGAPGQGPEEPIPDASARRFTNTLLSSTTPEKRESEWPAPRRTP